MDRQLINQARSVSKGSGSIWLFLFYMLHVIIWLPIIAAIAISFYNGRPAGGGWAVLAGLFLLRWYAVNGRPRHVIKNVLGGQPQQIDPRACPWGKGFISLAASMDIDNLVIYRVESNVLNAVAVSGFGERAIGYTSALEDLLTTDQFVAVMAHELAHHFNRDTRQKAIAHIFDNAFDSMRTLFAYTMNFTSRLSGIFWVFSWPAVLALQLCLVAVSIPTLLLGYLISSLSKAFFMADSRAREYRADAVAKVFLENGTALAQALGTLNDANARTAIFDSHPPIHSRIEMLQTG